MKSSTTVWVGIRSVGERDRPEEITECSALTAVGLITMFIKENSIAQRFQIAIARTEGEVRVGLGLSKEKGLFEQFLENEAGTWDDETKSTDPDPALLSVLKNLANVKEEDEQ